MGTFLNPACEQCYSCCKDIPGLHWAISGFGAFDYTGAEFPDFSIDLSVLNQDSVAAYGTNKNGYLGWLHNPPTYSSAQEIIEPGFVASKSTWVIITDTTIKAALAVSIGRASPPASASLFREFTLVLPRCATLSKSKLMRSTEWTTRDEPFSSSSDTIEQLRAAFDAATITAELDL